MPSRTPRFLAAVTVLIVAAIFVGRGQWPWPRLSDVPTALPILVSSSFRVVTDTLQRGETVSTLFRRQGIKGLNFVALANGLRFDPRRVQAGLVFRVRRDGATNEPTHVEFTPGGEQRLQFARKGDGDWRGEAIPIIWTTDTIRVTATIETSLYEAIDREVSEATLDHAERQQLAFNLANVNEWSVDFSRDPKTGDHFAAVVERRISELGEVQFGNILASELWFGGRDISAYSYTAPDGKHAYYDGDGKAVRRAFLLTPVEFRYVSSGFSSARLHPVLGFFRRHEGIDYAAARGTTVRAAGDGTVTLAGFTGGYGRLVEIRHPNGVTTRYGHLNSIAPGIRPGAHVSQGDNVGAVGSSGLATGPHLHYEFRVNGVARDPRSVRNEEGPPLPSAELPEFRRQQGVLAELLDRGASTVAASLISD